MRRLTRSALFLLFCLTLCLCFQPAAFASTNTIVIPNGVKVIESEAFAGDTGITSLWLPKMIKMIGERAFYGCTNLRDVYYAGTTDQWDNITIQSGNGPLSRATIHCNYSIVPGPSDEPVTLVYAEVNPLDSVSGEMGKAFKNKVEALSGGNVKIDLQGSGVLGSENQILENLLQGGTICDICRTSASALASYGCEKVKLLAIPYTFADMAHFRNFVNSELSQQFLNEPQMLGLPVRGLCYGTEGFRHFFFRPSVKSLNDMKDLKIRVSTDSIMTGMVTDLGAKPTPVPFTELYSCFNTGIIDGAEQPAANYRSNYFQEVAPYLLLDGHTAGVTQILISDKAWAKLNEQQRLWVMEAAQYASQMCIENAAAVEQNVVTQLQNEGITVTYVSDKAPWRAACQPTIQQASAGQENLYQQILALK